MPPYFNDRQRGRKRFFFRLKACGFFVLFLIMVFGGIYLFFYSDFFRIKNISEEFSDGSSAPSLAEDLNVFFSSGSELASRLGLNSILNWKNGEVPGEFLAKYPEIEKISVKKNYWGRTVEVLAQKREKFGIWCLANKCFWFDKNGIAFGESPEMEGGLIRKVSDFSGREVKEGDSILESRFAGNLIKIFGVLESAGLGYSLKLDNIELQEITAVPAQNNLPEIYFSLRFDPSFGLTALEKLKEKNLANLSYIDLRVENRAYYK
jgi:hypothetical protein